MSNTYTEDEKAIIMVAGNLVAGSLSQSELEQFDNAMKQCDGDAYAAIEKLPSDTAKKAKNLLANELKLSVELDKLGQRGITAIFPEADTTRNLDGIFDHKPLVLFAAGNAALLNENKEQVSLSLSAFKQVDCKGIFIADRPFDSLLRDNEIRAALRESQALIISDAIWTKATIKKQNKDKRLAQRKDNARSEKYVFVSGSRSQVIIPDSVQEALDAIVRQNFGILIGDSDKGVDKEILDFLRTPLYENVTLFSISAHPRVNLEEEWKLRTIDAEGSSTPREKQMVKDRAMADRANWGLAVFDPIAKNRYGSLQVSSGTLRNTLQMLLQGKMVKFFYRYEDMMRSRNLKFLKELEEVLESYQDECLSEQERKSILSSKGVSPEDDASHVKCKKIMQKYRSLLKKEQTLHTAPGSSPSLVQETLPLF